MSTVEEEAQGGCGFESRPKCTSSFLAPRIAESSRRKAKITLRANSLRSQLCGHCNQNLSLKTFKKHKKLYYKSDGTWLIDSEATSNSCASASSECMHIVVLIKSRA